MKFRIHNSEFKKRGLRGGFTLVELLVVIAIIALLVGILIPSLGGARKQAKVVATQSLISSLGVCLDSFKAESRLGGNYPPSSSDEDVPPGKPRELIDNPFENDPEPQLGHTTGASLLVYALNGADGLGTPGFIDRGDDDDKWWSDFGSRPNTPPDVGGHALDPTSREPLLPRYGPYATNDTQRKSIQSVGKLVEKGALAEPAGADAWSAAYNAGDYNHLVFTDSFSHPILYYRARRAARAIVPVVSGPTPGVYDPMDNAFIVGDQGLGGGTRIRGLQVKGGPSGVHKLDNVRRDLDPSDPTKGDPRIFDPQSSTYDPNHAQSFERFIWDPTVSGRISPVNRETYLLISAGPDGIYGNADDVTNFGKK